MTNRQTALLLLLLTTVANLMIIILYFVVLLFMTLYFLHDYLEHYGSSIILLPLILSFVASFFSSRLLMKWADRKWQINRYLGQK